MGETRLTIGELAKRVDIGAKTLRYYEDVGLLPAPPRSVGGYRLYSEVDVRRAGLVRRAKALGMGLAEIRELVEFASTGTCGAFQGKLLDLVCQKQADVDHRIADLQRLKEDLRGLELHLVGAGRGHDADHSMLECSPDTCTCLGASSTRTDMTATREGDETMTTQPIRELTVLDDRQDCGCGCGGAQCGAGKTPQAVAIAPAVEAIDRPQSEACDCGCGCRG